MIMEISQGEEHAAVHAAALLATGRPHKHVDSAKNGTQKKIIAGVILICLLAVILAVIFVMKLHCDVKVNSCKSRCLSGNGHIGATCHCDPNCVNEGNCCLDYKEVCVEPSQHWTCSKLRCAEERLPNSLCSCAADCDQRGDCCANYNSLCKGEKTWLEEDCEDIKTPLCPKGFSKPPLLLISLDGFRAEYLKAYGNLLPAITKLRNCGTSTPYMRPAYPTKTFPNHYTIVTGLYPESHGIVDNKMYDVNLNATFSLKMKEKFNPLWYQGEPIWITAMNNNLKSGTFFWPGSDVPIKGKFPNIYKEYNGSVPFEKRMTTIFEWLNLPQNERPDFFTLYMEEPDRAGHRYGPMSSQVISALMNVDRIIKLLMDGLKQRKLHKCVNLVLLSDHGMEEASCKKAAYISSYQENIDDFIVIQGPAARVRPKRIPEEFFTFNYEGLVKNLSCRAPDQPMKAYLKEHLPKRLHFANNVRIERAHLYMKSQWQAALKPSEIKYCSGGFHGSDNVFKNMQAIFIGYGPGLKFKTTVAPFENIEVYNLLCDLLDVHPAPNNGTHGSLNHLLRNPPHRLVYPAEVSAASNCSTTAHLPAHNLSCGCSSHTEFQVGNNQLVISSNSDSSAKRLHLPFGHPRVLQENADYCVLHHSSYISAYSKDILMPLWVAYTLQPLAGVPHLNSSSEECVHADIRIPTEASQSCPTYKDKSKLTYGFLHPPNLGLNESVADSLITSNMAPMFTVFKGIWNYFHNVLVVKYSQDLNGVNIMSGPIFDKDFNGNYDIMTGKMLRTEAPVPTHFFVILTSCKNSSVVLQQCDGPLKAVSYILPHRPDKMETCHNESDYSWIQEWVQHHVARVRDIELLTGLSFYHDQKSVADTLQLKTFLNTF